MRLANAGCRDFFVATWAEAEALLMPGRAPRSRCCTASEEDMAGRRLAGAAGAQHPEQVGAGAGRGRPCDVMVDTGINRLGVSPARSRGGLLDGLEIDTLMSHLACADEDADERAPARRLRRNRRRVPREARLSLANSAGICLGADYAFDLTRPGLALYGGVPRREAAGHIRQVVHVEARIVQRRSVEAGGRRRLWRDLDGERPAELAILNIGYADGYLRGFSGTGRARIGAATRRWSAGCRWT
jgi:alanine racemase